MTLQEALNELYANLKKNRSDACELAHDTLQAFIDDYVTLHQMYEV